MNIYLTQIRKKYYQNDFESNVLNCTTEFWRIDEGIKDYLIKINLNPYVQSLYSKKYKRSPGSLDGLSKNSYVRFAYSKCIESALFKELIPECLLRFNFDDKRCVYRFEYPKHNPNFDDNVEDSINLACISDPNYFKTNTITIEFDSTEESFHHEFWKFITNKLYQLR